MPLLIGLNDGGNRIWKILWHCTTNRTSLPWIELYISDVVGYMIYTFLTDSETFLWKIFAEQDSLQKYRNTIRNSPPGESYTVTIQFCSITRPNRHATFDTLLTPSDWSDHSVLSRTAQISQPMNCDISRYNYLKQWNNCWGRWGVAGQTAEIWRCADGTAQGGWSVMFMFGFVSVKRETKYALFQN